MISKQQMRLLIQDIENTNQQEFSVCERSLAPDVYVSSLLREISSKLWKGKNRDDYKFSSVFVYVILDPATILEPLCKQVFPSRVMRIESNRLTKGFSVFLTKGNSILVVELIINDFARNPDSEEEKNYETQHILEKLEFAKAFYGLNYER